MYYIRGLFKYILTLIILIALSPILGIVLIMLFIYNNGQVFFTQVRVGKNASEFVIYKFKTMVYDEESGQSEITFLGKWLRKLSIDELPQLVNVLKGEMSLVGPRPLLPEYLQYYSAVERKRHMVRPGITGWAQVNGRNLLSWEDQFKLDIYYVDHQSFRLDILIIFKTFIAVFQQKQVYQREKFHRTNDQNSEVGRNG